LKLTVTLGFPFTGRDLLAVLESLRPRPWARGASRTAWDVLGLGFEPQILGIDFDLRQTLMATRHLSTTGSSEWLYYRARHEMDTLNCARWCCA